MSFAIDFWLPVNRQGRPRALSGQSGLRRLPTLHGLAGRRFTRAASTVQLMSSAGPCPEGSEGDKSDLPGACRSQSDEIGNVEKEAAQTRIQGVRDAEGPDGRPGCGSGAASVSSPHPVRSGGRSGAADARRVSARVGPASAARPTAPPDRAAPAGRLRCADRHAADLGSYL